MSLFPNGEQAEIERARAGDRGALERLLLAHSHQLTAHIAARLPMSLRQTYSVDDVAQEALLRAFLRVDRLRDTSPKAFVVWLKAIGEKTLMEMIKAQRRQKRGGHLRRVSPGPCTATGSLFEILEQLPDKAATASQAIGRQEALAALQVGLASLAADQRKAIQLHLLQHKTLQETAQAMGRAPAAIRGLVQRGKQRLGQAMGRASAWLSSR